MRVRHLQTRYRKQLHSTPGNPAMLHANERASRNAAQKTYHIHRLWIRTSKKNKKNMPLKLTVVDEAAMVPSTRFTNHIRVTSHLQTPDSSSRRIPRAFFEIAKNGLSKSKGSPGPPPKWLLGPSISGQLKWHCLLTIFNVAWELNSQWDLTKQFYGD